jgi:uncharacterized repeat protein (TIGR01451 family)
MGIVTLSRWDAFGTWRAIICVALLFLAALHTNTASAGNNRNAKVAVHVLPHDDLRTCSHNFPEISDCHDISTTSGGCGGIDVFPVFFDIDEYLGVQYGLSWPASGSCAFTTCSDLHIGDITQAGDGISQVWFACKVASAVIPGFGWIDCPEPARVCVIPHPETGYIDILDCNDDLDQPVAVFCAGVCGETGDDPCETVFVPLGLEKTDGSGGSCVVGGDSITYAIAYDNGANLDDVHNVILTDDLPSEAEFISCSAGGTYDSFDHSVTWQLGTLGGGGSGTAEVTVGVGETVMPGGSLENRCSITSDETPTTQAAVHTDVCPETYVPLGLVKYDDTGGDCVDRGQDIIYTLAYDNASNTYDAHGVVLTDFLPDRVEYVSSSGGGVYDEFGHEVVWDLGTLTSGGAGQAEVAVRVDDAVPGGAEMCNHAEITCSETPTTEVTDCIHACADLMSIYLSKIGLTEAPCADRGDTITYEIDYENPNAAELEGVFLTDYLPNETEFVGASSGGVYQSSDHTVAWQIGSLAAGQAGALEIVTLVKPDAIPGTTITNRCEATADGTLPSSAEAATDLCPLAPLNLAKTDGRDGQCVSRGTRMTYVITYDNLANSEHVDAVVLTDYLSSRLDFRSATGGGVYEAAGHKVVWDIGILPAGASDTVRLAVEVRYTASPGSNISNRCEIAGTGTGVTEATSSVMVCEPGDFQFKVAVHVMEHDAHRTCASGLPAITACRDINTTLEAYSLDAFPVFFDMTEYLGLEYGLAWCDSGPCEDALFTSCSDLAIGDIEQSGDGISQTWFSCQSGPAVPGWAWIYASGPSLVCTVPHPVSFSLSVLGCSEDLGTPMCNFCAGVYGEIGDDPCQPTSVQPTSWGAIKAMFR